MLVRRSTLTFVVVAAGVFVVGSFVVYQRPDYLSKDVLPEKWRDWSGLGSDPSDIPLPAGGTPSNDKTKGASTPPYAPPPSSDGDLHILPIGDMGPGEINVKPLPISSENTHRRPIAITSPVLKERLIALLGAPMPTYPQSIKESAKTCPSDIADRQVNPDQHAGNLEKWLSIDSDDLTLRRLGIVEYMEVLDKEGKVPLLGEKGKAGKGRGIVMTGGNQVCINALACTNAMCLICRISWNLTLGHNRPIACYASDTPKRVQM